VFINYEMREMTLKGLFLPAEGGLEKNLFDELSALGEKSYRRVSEITLHSLNVVDRLLFSCHSRKAVWRESRGGGAGANVYYCGHLAPFPAHPIDSRLCGNDGGADWQ